MPFEFVWLVMTIPAALVVAIGLAVRSRALNQNSDTRWQQFLLLTMALLVFGMILPNSMDYFAFFLIPSGIGVLATFLLSLTGLHFGSSRRIKTTVLSTLGIGILVVILSVVNFPNLTFLVIPALIMALTWRIWDWHSPWRWVALLFLLMLLAAECDLIPSVFSASLPESFQTIDEIARFYLQTVSIVTAARLVHTIFIGNRIMPMWNIAVHLLLAALIMLTIAYQIVKALPLDIMTDGLTAVWIADMASFAGIATAMLLAWSLDDKRKWIAVGFALLIMFLFPSLMAIDLQPSPVVLTEQRAEQVNQAILDYHAQEAKYPITLVDLSPRYLWQIPQPIMLRSNTWCYEGGKDYYRLGYFFHEGFGAPASVRIQGSAGTPPRPEWQCDRDVANYNLSLYCGYGNRTGCQPRSGQNP